MDINQVIYFLNLAETLNFTEAARRSGVSQPSLTRAVQRLEEELGSPLIYRDGKDSRLTALGREIQTEFMRIELALRNVREHSESTVHGRRRILDIAVAPTIGPAAFAAFFEDVLGQLPSVKINLHQLLAGEGADEVLSGKYHACVRRGRRPNPKLEVMPLSRTIPPRLRAEPPTRRKRIWSAPTRSLSIPLSTGWLRVPYRDHRAPDGP